MTQVAELQQEGTRAEPRSNVIDVLDAVLTPDELLEKGSLAERDEMLTLKWCRDRGA
jgi:hypothetical protein